MFNIGDEVYIKNSEGLRGIVFNKINGIKHNDYLVKTEIFEKWYHEHELKLASTISKMETTKHKFKVGDEVVYGELYHHIGTIKSLMQNNGKNIYQIYNSMTGKDIICDEEDVKLLTFKDQKGNAVKRSEKLTISDIDYSIKSDQNKPQLHLVPISQLWTAIARVREYGVSKYGDNDSWKKVELKRYHDALLRHTAAIAQDLNAIDEESGLPHRWHIACNLAFIEALMEER